MKGDIEFFCVLGNGLSIDRDLVFKRDAITKHCRYPVYLHFFGFKQAIGFASRADAGFGYEFVYADFFHVSIDAPVFALANRLAGFGELYIS